jgi:hypothetical protein
MMVYEATHISDLTFRLERLDKLKPGAIDELLRSVALIRGCSEQLDSPQCQDELFPVRSTEVQQGRKTSKRKS